VKLDVGMLTHDLKSIPAYARKVEALGFDCLWSSETQHEPFMPLAVAASVTVHARRICLNLFKDYSHVKLFERLSWRLLAVG